MEQRCPRRSLINDQQQQRERQRRRTVTTQPALDVSDKTKSVRPAAGRAGRRERRSRGVGEGDGGRTSTRARSTDPTKQNAEQAAELEACDRLVERKKEWTEVLGKLLEKKRVSHAVQRSRFRSCVVSTEQQVFRCRSTDSWFVGK